jgi:hypothetical protein
MTDERIKQLRAMAKTLSARFVAEECLDAIVALKAEIKDANKAIKLAMKGRK